MSGAPRSLEELEDELLAVIDATAAGLPPIHRLVARTFIERVRDLVRRRRESELERARYYAELFARVEALEGAELRRVFAGAMES